MLFPSFFAQNLLHFSFIIIAFATSNHPFKPMTTQAMIKIIADYFKTQPVLKAWLFGPLPVAKSSDSEPRPSTTAGRTPRVRFLGRSKSWDDFLVWHDKKKNIDRKKKKVLHMWKLSFIFAS